MKEPSSRETGSLRTDGDYIYSYSLPIGRFLYSDDVPLIYNYKRGSGGKFVSVTTSRHITLIMNNLDAKNHPYRLVGVEYDD